jgi:unsaturated rhamnogalacturonyl hydrolase
MKTTIVFLFLLVVLFTTNCRRGEQPLLAFSVNNPSDRERPDELITLRLDTSITLKKNFYKIIEKTSGQELVSQLLDLDGDSLYEGLLVQVRLPAKANKVYQVYQTGKPVPVYPAKTYGRFVPERKDDFAWENDRIAFRMYGPALQKDGEISSGVDVWVKSVDYLILDKWYRPGVDYHTDHGEGLDYYKVGPSRGCGGIGIWDGKKLHVSQNFIGWKILANGPLRTVFELAYDPWQVDGVDVNEVKRITLDAGKQLNKFESRLHVTGNSGDLSMAVGIVDRGEGGAPLYDHEKGLMRYWEPADTVNGSIGCAVVVQPQDWRGTGRDEKNHLVLVTLPSVYYAGACWSKHEIFPDVKAWDTYLDNFMGNLKEPLQVTIEKNP